MPAYIAIERYEANLARMAAHRQIAASPGAPRDGSALLSGLLRCGGAHRMSVRYHTPSGRNPAHGYVCAYNQVNYGWIYRGWITARHVPDDKYWIITADATEIQRLRERRARPPGFYTRARWTQPPDNPPTQGGDPTMKDEHDLTGTRAWVAQGSRSSRC